MLKHLLVAMAVTQRYEQLEMAEMYCIVPGTTHWQSNMPTFEMYYFDG